MGRPSHIIHPGSCIVSNLAIRLHSHSRERPRWLYLPIRGNGHPYNIYIDNASRTALQEEAQRSNITFSQYIRIMARLFREPTAASRPIADIRERVRQFIQEERG